MAIDKKPLLDLYIQKYDILKSKSEYLQKLELVENNIQIFYLEDIIENLSRQLNMHIKYSDETDKEIEREIKKYNRIIGLLETKKIMLEANLISIKDDLQLVNAKIEIFDLGAEIASKRSFLAVFEKRKPVLG